MSDETKPGFQFIGKEATAEFLRGVLDEELTAFNDDKTKILLVLRIEHGRVVPNTVVGAMNGFEAMQYIMSHLPCQIADVAGDLMHKCIVEALDAIVPAEHKAAVASFLTDRREKKEHQH